MNNEQEYLSFLVNDLFRLGDYSNWIAPKKTENLNWYKSKNKNYDDGASVAQRLEELILMGADVSDKVYLMANINKVEPLQVALKYGANPNLPGKNKILPIDRAFYRGRTKIAQAILECPTFDFKSQEHSNALFLAIQNGKYKLANFIAQKRPDLILSKDKNDESVIYSLSKYLASNKSTGINSKVFTLLDTFYKYAETKDFQFSPNESHNNKTVANLSPEIALYLTEKAALKLEKELEKNTEKLDVKFKMKI